MINVQKGENYTQYWYRLPTPEYKVYPDSKIPCIDGQPQVASSRMLGVTVPKHFNKMGKKFRYIVNFDFNIEGKAVEWFCTNTKKPYSGWGGIIEDQCVNTDVNMYLLMDFFKALVDEGFVLFHVGMVYADTWFSGPCQTSDPCSGCWDQKENPDRQFLQVLFEKIRAHDFPDELHGLELQYDDCSLFGYSAGTQMVSRCINDFPFLKTSGGKHSFPAIQFGIMLSGGSLYCYTHDCKTSACLDPDGKPNKNFSPCPYPDANQRGCCPHNLSEPNYDQGKIPWSKHPKMVLLQSVDDYYADPMASVYYSDIMRKHKVPVERVTCQSTAHGLCSRDQIHDTLAFIRKHSGGEEGNSVPPGRKPQMVAGIVLLALALVLLVVYVATGHVAALAFMLLTLVPGTICLVLLPGGESKPESGGSVPKVLVSSKPTYLERALSDLRSGRMVRRSRQDVPELFDRVHEIQDKVFGDFPKLGGVLVHLTEIENFENLVAKDRFVYNLGTEGTCDCSEDALGSNQKTCSAWTYLRRDLPPTIFTFPTSAAGPQGWNTPTVATIIDPEKAWPLVTTTGIVDSGTDARVCGSWQSGFEVLDGSERCYPEVFDSEGNKQQDRDKYVIFKSQYTQLPCEQECDYENNIVSERCRIRNSGGGFNTNIIGWDTRMNFDCYDDCNCWRSQVIGWGDINENDQKALVKAGYGPGSGYKYAEFKPNEQCWWVNPYVAKPEDTPQVADVGEMVPSMNMQVHPSGFNYQYIGSNINTNANGANFAQSTWQNCSIGDKGLPVQCAVQNQSPISTSITETWQPKFLKEDFGRWLAELKKMWNHVFYTLDPVMGYKVWDGVDGQKGSPDWMYGNPCTVSNYWENEVNIYVNPVQAKEDDSVLNQVFRESVLGFAYVARSVEDMVSDLPTGTNSGDGCKFDNAKERAIGYLCNYTINKDHPDGTVCTSDPSKTFKDVMEDQKQRMRRARAVCKKMSKRFNETYGFDTKAYEIYTFCNAFPSYKGLEKWHNKTLKGSDVFREY